MITQQAAGWEGPVGGQALGEMRCGALEAFGAAYALQELLTIKSPRRASEGSRVTRHREGEDIPEAGIRRASRVTYQECSASLEWRFLVHPPVRRSRCAKLDEDVFRNGTKNWASNQPTRAWVRTEEMLGREAETEILSLGF